MIDGNTGKPVMNRQEWLNRANNPGGGAGGITAPGGGGGIFNPRGNRNTQ
jgi:hypothetical protein